MKELREVLQDLRLNDIERPLAVAAAMLPPDFKISNLTENEQAIIKSRLSFTERINLEEVKQVLRDKNFSFDLLSQLYGNDYSYSGKNGHELGIVLTPEHITELCCELMDLREGDRVYEPCCGTGRFLVNAMKYVKDDVYGVELQEDLFTISNSSLILNGAKNSYVRLADFFNYELSEKCTAGFMNPPYSQKKSELEFIEKFLDDLEPYSRACALVPVSSMIGKTKNDKAIKVRLLAKNTLEGVINLNPDTFYGVGTVPCLAMFKTGCAHDASKRVKFVNFTDDGYEVKKHVGLVASERAPERKKYLLDCWRENRTDYRTDFMVKSEILASDEWLHNFYYYNDEIPSDQDFIDTIADYLTFEANMIFHGRSYLFND